MKRVDHFDYVQLERITRPDGVRHYRCPVTNLLVPSVTTILGATSNNQDALLEWRKRVGDTKADKIRDQACALGSLMHLHIENHVMGIPRPRGTNQIRVQAERMADQIIGRGLPNVDEVWGQEVSLFYPGLYAGTSDLVGLYNGRPAIMDHKTSKKMKKRKDILDYFHQLSAYAVAHDEVYGTNIEIGVIFMVDRAFNFEQFVVEIDELEAGKADYLERVENYFAKFGNPVEE
jgi:hypothetical protein